jgi:hypothetical protein
MDCHLFFNDFITLNDLKVEIRIFNETVTIKCPDIIKSQVTLRGITNMDLSNSGLTSIKLVVPKGKDLKGLSGMNHLKQLTIDQSYNLTSLKGLSDFKVLEDLAIIDCEKLKDISALQGLKSLRTLKLELLPALDNVSYLAYLSNLIELDVTNCHFEVRTPRTGKINQEQTRKYQIKIKEHYKLPIEIQEKAGLSKESKQQLSAIKKMLLERDPEQIETAISLLEGLDDEAMFENILEGIVYNGRGFNFNRFFESPQIAEPYTNYALFGVLYAGRKYPYAQRLNEQVDQLNISMCAMGYMSQFVNLRSIKITGISKIMETVNFQKLIDAEFSFYGQNKTLFDFDLIKECKELISLDFHSASFKAGFSGIEQNQNLESLNIDFSNLSTVDSLKPLQKLSSLKNLSFHYCSSTGPLSAKTLDGLQGCIKLQQLEIDGALTEDTTALKSLTELTSIQLKNTKIKELTLPENAKLLSELKVTSTPLEKINDIEFPKHMKSIYLNNTNLVSFPFFRNLETLESIELDSCQKLKNLDGISSIHDVRSFSGHSGWSLDYCPDLENIDGIAHFNFSSLSLDISRIPKKIKSNRIKQLRLHKLISCENIENFNMLEHLNLSNSPINNLKELGQVKTLKHLRLNGCKNLETLDGIEQLKYLETLYITDTTALTDIKALEKMNIGALYIAGSLLKKADFPVHLHECINWQSK